MQIKSNKRALSTSSCVRARLRDLRVCVRNRRGRSANVDAQPWIRTTTALASYTAFRKTSASILCFYFLRINWLSIKNEFTNLLKLALEKILLSRYFMKYLISLWFAANLLSILKKKDEFLYVLVIDSIAYIMPITEAKIIHR